MCEQEGVTENVKGNKRVKGKMQGKKEKLDVGKSKGKKNTRRVVGEEERN